MFGCKPLHSWQLRFPLWLCDDKTDLVLNHDVGLNPETEGRRRILVLCSVVPFTVCFDFRLVIEYFGYFILLIAFLCFTHLYMLLSLC